MWKVLFVGFLANLILVQSTDIEIKCGEYERYDECPERVCEPRSCLEIGLPMDCSMSNCYKPACLCIGGYVRNKTADCIPVGECGDDVNNTCVEENYTDNGCGGDANATSGCDVSCKMRCPGQETSGSCSCPENNSCKCKENYLFNTESYECVLPEDCPSNNGNYNCGESNNNQDINDGENEDNDVPNQNDCTCQCPNNNENNNNYDTEECNTDISGMPLGECSTALEALRIQIITYDTQILYGIAKLSPKTSFARSLLATFFQVAQLGLYSYGETFAEISKAFNIKTKDEILCCFRTIYSYYTNFPCTVTFTPVLETYANTSNPFTCDFKNTVMMTGGEALNVNFSRPGQSADEINESVQMKTNNLVTADLVTNYYEFNSMTSLVLIAAAFFQAQFKYGFDPQKTITGDFYVDPMKSVKAQFMTQTEIYNYTESLAVGAQIINIPFAAEGLDLYIALPIKKNGLLAVLKKFTNVSLYLSVMQSLKPSPVNVKIPKMAMSTLTNTVDIIKNYTSIRTIFNSTTADFKNITYGNMPLEVSRGFQRLSIATTGEGGPSPNANFGAYVKTYNFYANRPFIFVVTINTIPIYSGVVANLDGMDSTV